MKINIDRIPPDAQEISEQIDSQTADLDREDLKFISALNVNAKLRKTVNVVSTDVIIKAKILFTCARCLKEEEKDFIKEYNFNYEIRREERFIDFTPDIREEIILGFPVKLLCKPDCKGLCVKCGQDLNLGSCDCKK